MANVIKLRKGLDINLTGRAQEQMLPMISPTEYAVVPDDFPGLTPKVTVREGDHVRTGDPLFVDKGCTEVSFASPVSGTVTAVERGERRKVLRVKIAPDAQQEYADFGVKDVAGLTADNVKESLLQAGLFGYVNQLPYAVATRPDTAPKAIFVSALRDKPLQGDFEYELNGQEKDFQTGLTALSKIAKVYLGIGAKQAATALTAAKDVQVTVFDGPCPAGNVGVQVNHIDPVNKGEVVWTVDPTAVIFFGRLFNTGKVNLTRRVAIAGSMVKQTGYVDVLVGTPLRLILDGNIADGCHVRILNGNPLTGVIANDESVIGAHTSEVTLIPEGDDVHEMFGWMLPRFKDFSASRSYFTWLQGKKAYNLDARLKGGERHMIMSGEYDSVLPMDIYGEYLIKSILSGNIDSQEQLGIYEVSPEDFALAEFVDSSKLPLQKIVREGLDILRKENA
ncbi:Na(+)-translocating NADH-quinone reductase subunit A [Prevotella jejuni]|uniref:Na(+)-translocating NADH-quinone reductase subunit A n=1 Tax=Prevotella jejuni TaxID=1177574 RepID=UPI003C71155B